MHWVPVRRALVDLGKPDVPVRMMNLFNQLLNQKLKRGQGLARYEPVFSVIGDSQTSGEPSQTFDVDLIQCLAEHLEQLYECSAGLKPQHRKQLMELLKWNTDVISASSDDMGHTDIVQQ